MLNKQGRSTTPVADNAAPEHTFTGNRGLQIEEPLLFEIGRHDVTGVDLPDQPKIASKLGAHARQLHDMRDGRGALAHIMKLSEEGVVLFTSDGRPRSPCTGSFAVQGDANPEQEFLDVLRFPERA